MTQTLRPQHDDARKIALTPYNRKGSYILVSNRPKGSRASINETGRNVEGIRAPTQDEIVVAAYTAAQEITHISPNDLNYIFVGAMGQGSSHALGLARGRPDGRVILFDGDGSLLTNLGSLVTIANQAPTNLVHCLCENGCYETTGSVPIPRRGKYVLPSWPRQGTVGRTKFPISPSGKASCLTSSKKKGRFSLALKSNPAKRTRKISRSYPAQSTGKISPCVGQWLTNKTMEYHRPLRSTAVSDVYETNRRGNRPESESFAALVSQVRRPGTAGERG